MIATAMEQASLSLWAFRATASGRPRDDHRHMDRVNDRVADRTQHHAGQAASAVTAHDDKLSGFRLFDQRLAGRSRTKSRCTMTSG